ncbi:MAG: hypothetical protein GX855_10865 [Firmicutes bacterium]|nr:hypothetical protein [Bacillota bacterium]
MYRLARSVIACLIGVGMILSGSMARAYPDLPLMDTPKIWLDAGVPTSSLWVVQKEELTYIEAGLLKDNEAQVLVGDLLRGGWRNVQDELDVDDHRLWADFMSVVGIHHEVGTHFPSLSTQTTRVLTAHRGQWQATIYVEKAKDGVVTPELQYFAICTSTAGWRTWDWNLIAPPHYVVPGSQLIGAAVGSFEGTPVEIYRLATTSSGEAVATHFRRLSPDWIVYSAGIHGAFGFNSKEAMYLVISPHETEEEVVHYFLTRLHVEDEEL